MSRKSIFTPETRAMARRLREEEGKSYAEISRILGINKSSLIRAGAEDNWSNGKAENNRKAKAEVTKIEHEHRTASVKKQIEPEIEKAIAELEDTGLKNPKEYSLKMLSLSLPKLMRMGQSGDIKCLIAANNAALKMAEATGALTVTEETRKLTVYVPEITEVYDEPPEDNEKVG